MTKAKAQKKINRFFLKSVAETRFFSWFSYNFINKIKNGFIFEHVFSSNLWIFFCSEYRVFITEYNNSDLRHNYFFITYITNSTFFLKNFRDYKLVIRNTLYYFGLCLSSNTDVICFNISSPENKLVLRVNKENVRETHLRLKKQNSFILLYNQLLQHNI